MTAGPAPPASTPAPAADTDVLSRPAEPSAFTAADTTLGAFDPGLAARLTAVAADIALVIDAGGVIRDVAIADPELAREPLAPLLGQRWVDTVGADSVFKVDEMLRTTPPDGVGRWRIVNQRRPDRDGSLTLRFMTVGAGARPDHRARPRPARDGGAAAAPAPDAAVDGAGLSAAARR